MALHLERFEPKPQSAAPSSHLECCTKYPRRRRKCNQARSKVKDSRSRFGLKIGPAMGYPFPQGFAGSNPARCTKNLFFYEDDVIYFSKVFVSSDDFAFSVSSRTQNNRVG